MNDFVPKFHLMDPKTEDLLYDGIQLRNGMKVLIEGSNFRVDVNAKMNAWQLDRALMNNRWCTVQNATLVDDDTSVRFMAVYEDGSKMIRTEYIGTAWFVKKSSIFINDIERIPNRHKLIHGLVTDAFRELESLVSRADYPHDKIQKLFAETVDKIVNIP